MRASIGALAALVLVIAVGGSAVAGEIEPNFARHLETMGDNEFASAIVYLADHPDIRALDEALRTEGATMRVRHERVLTELKQAADRSQPVFLDYLGQGEAQGSVAGFTPYWIANMIVVSATKAELETMAQRADVEYVEANFSVSLIEAVDEPYLGDPTAGIGVTNSLSAINADRVWNELGITGAGTIVANMDTGVDGNHPALSARWRGNFAPWQECWRDALGGGTQFPTDLHYHGTHTMGTMTGAGHATGDTVGVAFDALWIADNSINQGVGSEFDNDVLGAFQWFADPDGNPATTDDVPDVLQNSWGIDSRFGGTYQDCDYRWQAAIEACEAAGVVVTFSAGNEGPGSQTHRSPANIINTPTTNFAVGAVDAENYSFPYPIASFSSRGPSDCDGVTIKPEVAAPGVSVYSCYPGGGYTLLSGTSMAGPHVAGVAALMRQANPNADVQTIKEILMSTARDEGAAGEDNNYGWGVIDAYAAVMAVMQPDNESPTVTVTSPNGGEVLSVGAVHTITWIATDNVGVSQTDVFYSTDGGANFSLVASLLGNPGSYDWTVPNTPTTQGLVKVVAYDAAGNQAEDDSDGVFTIEAPVDNEPPAVTVTSPNGGEILGVGTVHTITWNATDNVGVTQTDVLYSTDGGANFSLITNLAGNPGSYDWTVPNTPTTQGLVKVVAHDAAGNQGEDDSDGVFTIEVVVGPYVYVASINMALDTHGPWTEAEATVLVLDQDDNPVNQAQVSSHWEGLTTDSDVFTTKRQGTGTATSDKLRSPSGCWDFWVDDVAVAGHVFRDDLGEVTDQICAGGGLKAGGAVVAEFSVSQVSRNPAGAAAVFSVGVPAATHVRFVMYDVTGRVIRTLADETLPAGVTILNWDGTNERGEPVPSGIYFYRVTAGDREETRKFMLMR